MKDSGLRIYSLAIALTLLAFTSLAARAQDTADDFLSDLHRFRIANYMALDAFYRFSADTDTNTLNEIVVSINTANDAMNTVSASSDKLLSQQQIESMNQEFDRFKALMRDNINDVRKTGYPELRLVSDMANQAQTMNNMATELYLAAQQNTRSNADPRVEAARSAAVKMAQMMTKYSVRSNTAVTQTFQGSATEKTLDEQAREFEALLASVADGAQNGELVQILDDLQAKWAFIRNSYINYNENNVGFVIGRYSKSILTGLSRAIELLEANA